MVKILLVRHGHVEGIKPERFRGRADLPLTEIGQSEAIAVAKRIARLWQPNKIYASPLQRCLATAEAISKACDLEITKLRNLIDIDYGDWQFRDYEEVRAEDPELFAKWFRTPHLVRFPGGESLQELFSRAAVVLRFILAHHTKETVVLVSHDSFNRAFLVQLLDHSQSSYWRLVQDPCCLNEIDIAGDSIRIMSLNETFHLDDCRRR